MATLIRASPARSPSAGNGSSSSRRLGLPSSWRANLQRAQEEFADTLAAWLEEEHAPDAVPPEWTPWQTPTLKQMVIQANANVALLQPSQETSFAYWLRISTLEKRAQNDLPPRARWPLTTSAGWRASVWTAA